MSTPWKPGVLAQIARHSSSLGEWVVAVVLVLIGCALSLAVVAFIVLLIVSLFR